MNKLIKAWIDAREATKKAHEAEKKALGKADAAVLPEKLIKAQAKDIIQGNIIWYPECYGDRLWNVVEEVLRPEDDWKAYCAQDGCRYGLDGAFIEEN